MTIKIWCAVCEGSGEFYDYDIKDNDDCPKCQGNGYREVTLDKLIKPMKDQPYNYEDGTIYKEYIESCLNLELLI